MNIIRNITKVFSAALCTVLVAGCVESLEEKTSQYGYFQLKLVKAPESTLQVLSKAGDGDAVTILDSLADASKIRLSLQGSDEVLEQTLTLEPAAGGNTEWGMWTEKLQLYADTYRLLSYEVLGNLDQTILTSAPEDRFEISVVPGGLVVKELGISVRNRGNVKFEFSKSMQVTTKANTGAMYRFENVETADVTVKNLASGANLEFKGMDVAVEYYYKDPETEGGDYITSSRLVCDTLVNMPAGNYEVAGYIMYDDAGEPLEGDNLPAETCAFTVADNTDATVSIPVTFTESAPQIKDGIILKQIWDALDGPNWSYSGIYHQKGCNWDFSREMDLWVAQPGVMILNDGHVSSIDFTGFGAKGDIPECIGNLEKLKNLTLGRHDESAAGTPQNPEEDIAAVDNETFRSMFKAFACPETGLETLAPELWTVLPAEKQARLKENSGRLAAPVTKAAYDPADNYSTFITSLPESIGNLTELTRLVIANSPITSLPESLKNLTSLTDLEVFNCRKMTVFPDVITEIPNLQMLYFGSNTGLSAQEMYRGLSLFNTNEAVNPTVQGMYLMDNNLETIPDMTNMKRLKLLDLSGNNISSIEKAFGKEMNFATLDLSDNELGDEDIVRDAEGYFAGYEGMESWSFSGNDLTVLPDIFNSNSPFYMGTVDFSSNRISSVENGNDGTYKGFNADTFNLSFNALEEFPACIYNSGSKVNYLVFKGNAMKTVSEEALEGEHTYYTNALDLSMNRIRELPSNFNNRTFPYMTGLDLSWNAFDAFPWVVTNLSNMENFLFRGQRDDRGYRCMKEWPVALYGWSSLKVIYLGSNDIGKVTDSTLDRIRFNFEITDNPNISMDLSTLCPYIQLGLVSVLCDPDQDIQGCDILFQ